MNDREGGEFIGRPRRRRWEESARMANKAKKISRAIVEPWP